MCGVETQGGAQDRGYWKIWVPFWSSQIRSPPAFFGLAQPVPIASLHTLLDGLNPNVDPAGDVVSAAAGILSLSEVLLDKYSLA